MGIIMAPQMALISGTKLGPYQIQALIGAGGMGEVYRARDTRLNRSVAVKILPASFASDPDRLRRFEQEARAVAALNHPNILAIHDIGTQEGTSYLVSEFLEGNTLRTQLANGALATRKAIEYALQIAQGLAAAHDKGIVHRDLKPENIFITKEGRLKILDFGLAKVQIQATTLGGTTEVSQTTPGAVMGTAGYMSPEQVRGEDLDHRSDIFSFGAVLYEMLSGNRAFKGDTSAEIMSAILRDDPPELVRATPPVHPAVDRTIRRCLEKNPLERFQSARDLGFQLQVVSEDFFPKAETAPADSSPSRRRWVVPLVIALVLVASSLPFLISRLSAKPELPAYKRLTFRSGSVGTARFSSDGRTIIYGAAWAGNPSEIFVSRVGSSDARPLGIGPSELLSVSRNGELAVLMKPRFDVWWASGTLATVPLEGGTPREFAENVTAADWAPDGSGLAIVRDYKKLEYPIGKVLFQSAGLLSHPRFSPDGKSIAFIDHPPATTVGSLVICDTKGSAKVLASGFASVGGVAWTSNGKEIWFGGVRGGIEQQLLAVSRDGKERLVTREIGSITVHDVAQDGRVLFTRDDFHTGITALVPHSTEERDLSWFDVSLMGAISADGEMIAFSESGEAVAGKGYSYVRSIRGTPAVRLGEGRPWSISPDKKWVVATAGDSLPLAGQLVLLPTGPGEPKRYPPMKESIWSPTFVGDGKQIIFAVKEGDAYRIYLMALDTGEVKPALPEGVSGIVVSPDGKYVVASSVSDPADKIYDLAGGPPRPIKGLKKGEFVEAWGTPPLPLYASAREGSVVVNLLRLDPVTGQRRVWRRLIPSDPAGVRLIADLYIAPDAQAYGYSYYRLLSQLYVAEGLR
jgi:eukaryotic-like serine/threonine-protein kinase